MKLKDFFKTLVNQKIEFILGNDNEILYLTSEQSCIISHKFTINFFNGSALCIYAADEPHFYGEGDLNFEIKKPNIILIPKKEHEPLIIENITVWGYRPKGINLFPTYNEVLIEFQCCSDINFSIGFFNFDSKKAQFIGGGEIALNFGFPVNDMGIDRLKKIIRYSR